MKKAIKIIVTLLAMIMLGVIIGVSICVPIANKVKDTSIPVEELSFWQSMIKDDALLKQVAIPGSHDAGTKDMPWYSKTQSRDIKDQLACGTRYFDLRIKLKKGEAKIYHGPAVSSSLKEILSDINDFLTVNNQEAIILDFQKFGSDEAKAATLKLIDECLVGKVVVNDTDLSDLDFVDNLTLGEVRGKCLLVWGANDGTSLKNDNIFLRNDDKGEREDACLQSYYTRKWNWYYSSEKYIDKALPAYIDMYKENGKGLFVLQGQLTDGALIAGPRYREGGHEKNMNAYVTSLAQNDNLQYINIVMRDFVSPNKNCATLKLNEAKGIVKAECQENYANMLAKPAWYVD